MVIRNLLLCLIMTSAFAFAGCSVLDVESGGTVKPIGAVPGTNVVGARLIVKDDGTGVIILGRVNSNVDKVIIEKYVRETLGYKQIDNRVIVNQN